MAATSASAPSSKYQWWYRKPGPSKPFLKSGHSTTSLVSVTKSLMTPVATAKPMSSSGFTTSSTKSRFNLSAVLPSFAYRSKKQQSLEIQDPPSHVRSLPSSNKYSVPSSSAAHSAPNPRLSRGAPTSIPSPNLSRGITPSTAGTSRSSRLSTDGPLTPSDGPSSSNRYSYQRSLITVTNESIDPLASDSPRKERRSSAHSEKSIGKRIMSKVEGKSKSMPKLPMHDPPPRKHSRERSATLPSRSAMDTSEMYLPLRAVEPPWKPSSPPQSPRPSAPTSPRNTIIEPPPRPTSNPPVLRKSRSSRPIQPWSETRPTSQPHYHTRSSSSTQSDVRRGSSGISIMSSHRSGIPFPPSPVSSSHDIPMTPTNGNIRPPRPPPTQELPPTPGSAKKGRPRGDATLSASAASATSSLSSLSFTSRPSPQEPVPPQAYPSLLEEKPPGEVAHRRSESASSSTSRRSARAETTPKPPKQTTMPLPSPPVPQRERTSSATSTRVEGLRALGESVMTPLRRQRSFHHTSSQAPNSHTPTLRHYSSFGTGAPSRDPLPKETMQKGSSSPSSLKRTGSATKETPQKGSSSSSTLKRTPSASKESTTSPRRRLFSPHRHDRERKHEADSPAAKSSSPTAKSSTPTSKPTASPPAASPHTASPPASPSAPRVTSSWFDEPRPDTEPADPDPPDVAQHIVPPAELLRLGAAWERESESESKAAAAARAASRPPAAPPSVALPPPPSWAVSRLPRSASLFTKAPFAQSPPPSPAPPDSYTSLSPPPRRVRPPSGGRRTISHVPVPEMPKGVRVERKPSFLDMTTARSVSIELPEERGSLLESASFLELSRGMDSIETIRESEASFH